MVHSSCLCGAVTWEQDGPLELFSHCHCSRCRKHHGTAFSTWVVGDETRFRLRGGEKIVHYQSSPAMVRSFCGDCGSVVPGGHGDGRIFLPAGNLDDDPGIAPAFHIFAASKAPWYEITDDLPRFDAFPDGFDAPVLPDPEPEGPAGKPRGSCLCGGVAFVLEGVPGRALYCHCSRCRKARSAAHAANLFLPADGVRFLRGEDLLTGAPKPGETRFSQLFCRVCGAKTPVVRPERGFALVPMGSLDDDPGIRAAAHIFVGSKAPWETITGDIPQFEELPPKS